MQEPVHDYLAKRGLTGKYSQFTFAGAAIGVVAPKFADWHKTFWDNLAASIELHNIKSVIAIDHRDCGAAKIAYGDKPASRRPTRRPKRTAPRWRNSARRSTQAPAEAGGRNPADGARRLGGDVLVGRFARGRWPTAAWRARRSAPIMSAACCARRSCCGRGPSIEAGRISAAALRQVEDEAIRDAVRMQAELGLQGVTDGELRRGSWHMDFLYQIGGVVHSRPAAAHRVQERGRHGRVQPDRASGRRQADASTRRSSARISPF